MPGKGTLTIEWPRDATIDRIVWGRDREGQYSDRLATEYYIEVATEPGQWRVVASSLDRAAFHAGERPGGGEPVLASELADQRKDLQRRQAELRLRLEQLGATISVYAGSFSQPGATRLACQGRPDAAHDRGCARRHCRRAAAPGSAQRLSSATGGSRWQNGLEILRTRCLRG